MAADLMERLERASSRPERNDMGIGDYWNLCDEAAAALRAEREARRAAEQRAERAEQELATLRHRLMVAELAGQATGRIAADKDADRLFYRERAERLAGLLGSLLARIHRDGGHYQHEHGDEKACADADARIVGMRAALDWIAHATTETPGCTEGELGILLAEIGKRARIDAEAS